jgi:hypothetical protein
LYTSLSSLEVEYRAKPSCHPVYCVQRPLNAAIPSVPGFRTDAPPTGCYFKLAGARHRGADTAEAEGLPCFGILAGASLETMLVTPWALIARTT